MFIDSLSIPFLRQHNHLKIKRSDNRPLTTDLLSTTKTFDMLRNIAFFLVFILTTLSGSAQTDKLYLKNDSKLVGKLLHYQPGDSIQFELSNGQKIVLAEKEVQRIVMADIKTPKPYNFKERGFYNATYFGFNFGKSPTNWGAINSFRLGISAENITGFQFNRWLGAGLILGYDNFYVANNDAHTVSIGSELRGYLSQQNTSFYYRIGGGIGFPLANKNDALNLTGHKGGFMLHPAIGIRLGSSPKIRYFIDLGTKFQRVHFDQNNGWSENQYTILYQRWVLRGGILF